MLATILCHNLAASMEKNPFKNIFLRFLFCLFFVLFCYFLNRGNKKEWAELFKIGFWRSDRCSQKCPLLHPQTLTHIHPPPRPRNLWETQSVIINEGIWLANARLTSHMQQETQQLRPESPTNFTWHKEMQDRLDESQQSRPVKRNGPKSYPTFLCTPSFGSVPLFSSRKGQFHQDGKRFFL